MPIEINGLTGRPMSQTSDSKSTRKSKGSSTAGSSTAAADDSVNLTQRAESLQQLEQTIQSLPVVDSGRVEGMKDVLEKGEYEVDPPVVAEKIVDLESKLP